MMGDECNLVFRKADNNDLFKGKDTILNLRSGKVVTGTIKQVGSRYLGDILVDSGYIIDRSNNAGEVYIKFADCEIEPTQLED
jgi:hypothetical protein